MPSATVPVIRIASAATLRSVRSQLVEETKSLNQNMKEPYTSMMEALHGDGGAAILVYQKYCTDTQSEFNHALWHELGHVYAIAAETEPFHHLADQGLTPNRVRQEGYWVWNEFIAESIANHVGAVLCPVDAEKMKCQKYWRHPYCRLQSMIQSAHHLYSHTFSEYDLAFYFATLLTDPATKAFVDGAVNDELTVWDPDKWAYVPMKPGSIEPTALSMIPHCYGEHLLDMMDLLREKVEEPEFWKVDGAFLDHLGLLMTELNQMKSMRNILGQVSRASAQGEQVAR